MQFARGREAARSAIARSTGIGKALGFSRRALGFLLGQITRQPLRCRHRTIDRRRAAAQIVTDGRSIGLRSSCARLFSLEPCLLRMRQFIGDHCARILGSRRGNGARRVHAGSNALLRLPHSSHTLRIRSPRNFFRLSPEDAAARKFFLIGGGRIARGLAGRQWHLYIANIRGMRLHRRSIATLERRHALADHSTRNRPAHAKHTANNCTMLRIAATNGIISSAQGRSGSATHLDHLGQCAAGTQYGRSARNAANHAAKRRNAASHIGQRIDHRMLFGEPLGFGFFGSKVGGLALRIGSGFRAAPEHRLGGRIHRRRHVIEHATNQRETVAKRAHKVIGGDALFRSRRLALKRRKRG